MAGLTHLVDADVLIAAQARAEGLVVATRNVREFRRVKGVEVESWR